MKKMLCVVLAAVALTACTDEPTVSLEIPKDSPRMSGFVFPNSPSFKALNSRSESTFETEWENFQTVNVPDLGAVATPWAAYSVGTGDVKRKDIKKEDGWIMLMHTLSEHRQIYGHPLYVVLYNKMKGVMKLFYYHESQPTVYNNALWKVTFDCPSQAITNVNYQVVPPYSFRNKTNYQYCSSLSDANMHLIDNGWNMMELPLSYDPNIAKSYSINVSIYSCTQFDIKLYSKFEGKAEGTIVSSISSNPFSSVKESLFKFSGAGAETVLETFFPNGGLGTDLLKNVISGMNHAANGKAINTIFDTFFGSFSTITPTVQDVNISFSGESSTTGTVTAILPTGAKSINLPIGEDSTGIKLGTWNLSEPPTIYMHPVGVISSVVSPEYYTYDENTYTFRNSGNYNVPIVFNPQLKPHIKNYRIECTPLYRTYGGADARPYYPGDSTDVGSLGAYRNASVLPLTYPCEYTFSKNPNQQGSTLSGPYYANYASGTVTCWHLWHKLGKPDAGRFGYNSQYYKYVYAPACNEENYIRGGGFKYDARRMYLKVSVYSEMEFEGKTFKTLETRTYKPRFEWDPALVSKYGRLSVDDVYYYAQRDDLLRVIDNRILERK